MFAGQIITGGLLLVLGRKLFWLYVALLGFAAGLTLASRVFNVQPEWLQLVIGIVFGIIGAILAYFFQEIAVALAGFLAGAAIAVALMSSITGAPAPTGDVTTWIVFFVGGVVGAILAVMLFDWALIILSSLVGALLVTQGLQQSGLIGWVITAVLFVVGVIIQASLEKPHWRHHTTTTATNS